ncbi:TPA: BREX-1 system adenine-specific DNA-methyltransferase PglX [Vibrio parahaemolyticus]|nr:BREX-1 system adenine-specific DNA-methyltransferase PglX [Vibrio parahaemolyticus]
MDTSRLKKFAQFARRSLIEQVQTKLKLVLAEDSLARRESPKAVKELENKKQDLGEEQLLEQVAYTWFNRFCALRFMDANQYNRIMVVSPVAGQFQPEILAEAKAGHLDDSIFNEKARDEINGLLSGSIPSRDGQSEAYRLMIVAVCNDYHRLMPYLFERIEDYTELLMPDDLLSGNSILAYTREAMTPENCASVESIGWLYQFYISEKKDQVFEGLKKNKKITPENIPAATQLFTPHWIVRYLVENSLGRLWMLNNPNSKVIEQMDYYIKPVEEEKEYLKISSPEELKICDPACGSGHMLTYAYDLLYAIYLDAGYDSSEIPEKILTNNLYGIEIDERAAELAAFALSMKALKGNPLDEGNNRRRFFRNPIEPNICHIKNVSFSDDELDEYFEFVGTDLFTTNLRATLKEFEEADNFGSLIQPTLENPADVLAMLDSKDVSGQLFLADTHKSVLKALKQADYLSQKYQVVVANPPYMGMDNANPTLKQWVSKNYPEGKRDLFSAFVIRNLELVQSQGFVSMITMQNWMFISRFEKFRDKLLASSSLSSMCHLGTKAFDSIGGEVVSTTSYVLKSGANLQYRGTYLRLTEGRNESEKEQILLDVVRGDRNDVQYVLKGQDIANLPNATFAYWTPQKLRKSFIESPKSSDFVEAREGLATGKNEEYVRYWFEVNQSSSCRGAISRDEASLSQAKWFPYNKGGERRKWYGNDEYVVNWLNDGHQLQTRKHPSGSRIWAHNFNLDYIFKKSISWSDITTKGLSVRFFPEGFLFDATGLSAFSLGDERWLSVLCAVCNSKVGDYLAALLNPTLHFKSGDFRNIPIPEVSKQDFLESVEIAVKIARDDWATFETAPEFLGSPLIAEEKGSVKVAYEQYREKAFSMTNTLKSIERRHNEILIQAYGLEEELDPKVDSSEITLLSNPEFRFPDSEKRALDHEYKEAEFLKETVKDMVSYAVGCMLGRYSLDREGLVLSNSGEVFEDYIKLVPKPSFFPDRDNVIPIIDFDGDWFEDDITERFKHFLKCTFGEEHFSENLRFIENAIGKDIKKYFVKDFYTDHLKRYKKRPIYWMFSSPKGSFNALIYMHRYNKDTVDVVLNNYLREFRTKLLARKESLEQIEISASASQKDQTQAIKTIVKINKVLDEINEYEHDVLYPLAGEKVEIDLDDGVKHNYPLFGKALKKVPGLS